MVSDLSLNFIAKASGSLLKSTPRKLGLVVALIRGKSVADALVILKYCRKKASSLVAKVLNSAISNAQNNVGADIDSLYISEALVGKSMTLRRVHAKAMGRACRISKRYSNLVIKLSE